METLYHLAVNIQTPKGMLETGKFFLGSDQAFAEEVFDNLVGSKDLVRYPSIRLDLLDTSDIIPVCLRSIGCNLDQYTKNCRILTQKMFRHFMFDDPTLA